jgi:hypothetical protein
MSHFTTLKTRIVNKDYLLKALTDLGYNWQEGEVEAKGFMNSKTKVEISVPTSNPKYDIGFRREGDNWELVADWYGIRNIKPEEFMQKLQQRYAYHAVRDQLDQQDFSFVEEVVSSDNTIKLTLRRMI